MRWVLFFDHAQVDVYILEHQSAVIEAECCSHVYVLVPCPGCCLVKCSVMYDAHTQFAMAGYMARIEGF